MRSERPIHFLARQLQQTQPAVQIKRHRADMLLLQRDDAPSVALYLPLICPSAHDIGHILAQNSQHNIYSLIALPGDALFEDTAQLKSTHGMLVIFYPQKLYAYKILDNTLYILPAFLEWNADTPSIHFAPPIDLKRIKPREVEVQGMAFRVADFGAHPPYDPQKKFQQWQAKYGSGNGGRRTQQRRRPRIRRGFAADHYYQVLGLDRMATLEDIRLAYRELARQLHPDVNPSPEAKVRMQEINEAYTVLVKSSMILRK